MMKFAVLGPLEITGPGGRAVVGGILRSTLLLALLVNENAPVSADALVEELWGRGRAPKNAENALHAQVSRLRRALDRVDPHRAGGGLISRDARSYRVVLGPRDELDAVTFSTGLRDVQQLRRDERISRGEAAARLREILSLWRGPALGGLGGGAICGAAAVRYEERRLAALELLHDLELLEGNHDRIIGDLRELVVVHPLHERFCEQLMVALYRAGRQTEALDTYRRMWRRMTEDLGTKPTPALRRTAEEVLAHSPLLRADAPDHAATPDSPD